MAEMRLVVAGAGGRMGRTLVKAIADHKDLTLSGALEDARSPLIGWDAGTLAGLGENHVKLSGDPAALMDKADGMKLHMRHAHKLDISFDEIREVILQVMYYAGQAKGL